MVRNIHSQRFRKSTSPERCNLESISFRPISGGLVYEHPDTQSLVCLEKPGCDIIAEIVGGIAEESCFRFSVDVGDKVG